MARGGTGSGGTAAAIAADKMDRFVTAVAGNIPKFVAAPAGDVDDSLIAAIDLILRTGVVAYTANQPMGGFRITGAGDAVADQDLTTLLQVQNLLDGLNWKTACKAASTGNLALSGLAAIDGVTILDGNRVLAKDQTVPADNGLYNAAAGAWTRTTDSDTTAEMNNATVQITEGTVNDGRVYVQTTNNPTIGVDPIVFVRGPNVGGLPFTTILAGDDIESILENAAAGQSFYVGTGTFTIAGPILITADDLTIVMAEGTTLLGDNSGLTDLVQLAAGISGMRWTGGQVRPGDTDGNAIRALGAITDCKFLNLHFSAVGGTAAKDAFRVDGTADNVSWWECKFQGDSGDLDSGVRFNGGNPIDCKIIDNNFDAFPEGAIAYEATITSQATRQIIRGNNINSGIGIEINNTFRLSTIYGNTFTNTSTGILNTVEGFDLNLISSCIFEDASVAGIDGGSGDQNEIIGCVFTGCPIGINSGATFSMGQISSCVFFGGTTEAILFQGGTGTIIGPCIIDGNGALAEGINVNGGTDITVIGCTVQNMSGAGTPDGITMGVGCVRGKIEGCTTNVPGSGVLAQQDGAIVEGCTVEGGDIGINATGAKCKIRNCTVRNTSGIGILVSLGTEAGGTVSGCTVDTPGDVGISLNSSGTATGFQLTNCEVIDPTGDGIAIDNHAEGQVSGNRVTGGSADGIDLDTVTGIIIDDNLVTGCTGVGIRTATGSNNRFGTNQLRGNTAGAESLGETNPIFDDMKVASVTIQEPDLAVRVDIPFMPIEVRQLPFGVKILECIIKTSVAGVYSVDFNSYDDAVDTVGTLIATVATAGGTDEATSGAISVDVLAGRTLGVQIPATDIDLVVMTYYYRPLQE